MWITSVLSLIFGILIFVYFSRDLQVLSLIFGTKHSAVDAGVKKPFDIMQLTRVWSNHDMYINFTRQNFPSSVCATVPAKTDPLLHLGRLAENVTAKMYHFLATVQNSGLIFKGAVVQADDGRLTCLVR